jgi:hypothetical protein
VAEVEIQFAAYERALISSDVITLDRFFLGGNTAMRLAAREKGDRELRP